MKRSVKRGLKTAALLGLGFALYEVYRIGGYLSYGAGLQNVAKGFRREYAVGEGEPVRLVAMGDSTAAGVGVARVEESLPYLVASRLPTRAGVTNLAVSGATLRDVVREQLPRFPKEPVDIVLLSISANDATHGTDPAPFEKDLEALLTALRERNVERVVLTTTPNFRTTPALPLLANRLFERRAATLTVIIERVAARYRNVSIADLNREGSLAADGYAADGFHPNAAGYRKWADVLLLSARGR